MCLNRNIEFISKNLISDITSLSLNKHKFKDIDIEFCIRQIAARQKTRHKLPMFYNKLDLIFPASISVEQSSSELTAEYKANLLDYNTSIDLTGGMGIDSIYFAGRSKNHKYIEKYSELCDVFYNNCKVLGIENIQVFNADSIEFLSNTNEKYDLIYLDPARRNQTGNKTYFLEDTFPNPIEILNIITGRFKYIMIKTSPLLDISQAERELGQISKVYAISVDNECKELLLIIEKGYKSDTEYYAVNIVNGKPITTEFSAKNDIPVKYSQPLKYLYEPNSSIMKLGFFNEMTNKFAINKLAPNTHLYTSDNLIEEFPGRVFEILHNTKLDKKELAKLLPEKKANISVRNFPATVDEIRKITGLKDGGNIYLFASELENKSKAIIITKKIK